MAVEEDPQSICKVLVVAPIFNYEPVLVHALRAQIYRNWELLLIHDGPNSTGLFERLNLLADPRIRYYETERRHDDWGHSLRMFALDIIAQEPVAGDLILISNADNYYVPGAFDQMVRAFDDAAVAVYCAMLHNHYAWDIMWSELQLGKIDCGCVIVRREAALAVGWSDRCSAADWTYISGLIDRFGAERFRCLPRVLFVHN